MINRVKVPVIDFEYKPLKTRHGTRKRLQRIKDCVRAVLANLVAAAPRLELDRSRYEHRVFIRNFYMWVQHMTRVGLCEGSDQLISLTKQFSNGCRQAVFEHKSWKDVVSSQCYRLFKHIGAFFSRAGNILQASFIGRALPTPTERIINKALATHKKIYETPHQTPPEILVQAGRFFDDLLRKHAGYVQQHPITFTFPGLSQGACEEATCRQLGFANRISQLRLDESPLEWDQDTIISNLQAVFPGIGSDQLYILAGDDVLRQKLLLDFNKYKDNPEATVFATPERGAKARVITKQPASLVALSQPMRKAVFGLLKRLPQCSETLEGKRQKAVQSLFDGSFKLGSNEYADYRVVSADLTAASDRLPRDLVFVLWETLEKHFNFPRWARDVWRVSLGSCTLKYPDSTRIISQRGIFMGNPLTWVSLSIIHLFWAQYATQQECRIQRIRICGDDLIAYWPSKVRQRYNDIVCACGGQFSVGKHYESVDYGVFTEEIFRIRVDQYDGKKYQSTVKRLTYWEKSRKYLLLPISSKVNMVSVSFGKFQKCFPTKSLVSKSPSTSFVPGQRKDFAPWWESIGPSATSLLADRPGAPVVSVLKYAIPGLYTWFTSHGFLSPCLPRAFGGPGLPPMTSAQARITHIKKHLRRHLYHFVYRSNRFKPSPIVDPWVVLYSLQSEETMILGKSCYQEGLDSALEILEYARQGKPFGSSKGKNTHKWSRKGEPIPGYDDAILLEDGIQYVAVKHTENHIAFSLMMDPNFLKDTKIYEDLWPQKVAHRAEKFLTLRPRIHVDVPISNSMTFSRLLKHYRNRGRCYIHFQNTPVLKPHISNSVRYYDWNDDTVTERKGVNWRNKMWENWEDDLAGTLSQVHLKIPNFGTFKMHDLQPKILESSFTANFLERLKQVKTSLGFSSYPEISKCFHTLLYELQDQYQRKHLQKKTFGHLHQAIKNFNQVYQKFVGESQD